MKPNHVGSIFEAITPSATTPDSMGSQSFYPMDIDAARIAMETRQKAEMAALIKKTNEERSKLGAQMASFVSPPEMLRLIDLMRAFYMERGSGEFPDQMKREAIANLASLDEAVRSNNLFVLHIHVFMNNAAWRRVLRKNKPPVPKPLPAPAPPAKPTKKEKRTTKV